MIPLFQEKMMDTKSLGKWAGVIGLLLSTWATGLAQSGPINGCMDTTACNFDATATVSDGSCEYATCAGCTSPLACNYKAGATIQDDGSCIFVEEDDACAECSWQAAGVANPSDGSGTLVSNDADGDGVCDAIDLCSDPSACNYDATANANADCILKSAYYHDEDGDNVGDYYLGRFCASDAPEQSTTVLGPGDLPDKCVDTSACNYDASFYGNNDCETDGDLDGLCNSEDLCSDAQAPNYHAGDFGNEPCCIDDNDNGVCDLEEVFGCTDSTACNYAAIANVDDGTCAYHTTATGLSGSGTSQYALNAGSEDSLCDECIAGGDTITISASARDSLGLTSLLYIIARYDSHDADENKVCDDAEQVGCDDPNACNYRQAADGSVYPQLTDVYGDLMTDADGNPVFISRSCSLDEALGYGVTASEEPCSNYCLYADACGACGGTGEDVDGDGLCDDSDNCTDPSACNFMDTAAAGCEFLDACGVCGGSGVDVDADGICDSSDACSDLTACNFDDPADVACIFNDACGVCGGSGVDVDGDGLCDDEDNCTDTAKCNYDVSIYPGNDACVSDSDGDGICDPYEIEGCQDSDACNFNANATDDNPDLCAYAAEACETCSGDLHDGSDYVVLSDSDGDGICDDADACSDASACNYMDPANAPCAADADGNGVCDEAEVWGCTNPEACNFNAAATRNDGVCLYPTSCQTCSGATDGSGTRIDHDADLDGICDDEDNCSDTDACNYIAATSLNAACSYAEDGKNCAGDCLEDVDNDGICELDGADLCFDLRACNYAASANEPCIFRDSCGECGPALPGQPGYDTSLYCDCDLNVVDVLGNCGGGCTADVDNDGICDDVDPCLVPGEVADACGVCNGPGAVYECGCFELPAGACDCEFTGAVRYPKQGEDCDGNCIYGSMVVDGVEMCKFFDEADVTELPTPIENTSGGVSGERFGNVDNRLIEDWINHFDTLHARMSRNLDDGTITGAAERLTIEREILNKGRLDVLGNSQISGITQMDSDVVILGNLVIEQDLTVKGTTFSLGGIETTAMNMSGDLSVGGAAVIDSTLEVTKQVLLHDSLTVLGPVNTGSNRAFSVDVAGNTQINGQLTILDSLVATAAGTRLSTLDAGPATLSTLTTTGSTTIRNNLNVSNNTAFNGSLDIRDAVTLDGTLTVDGKSTFAEVHSTSISNAGILSSDSIFVTHVLPTREAVVLNGLQTSALEVTASATLRGPVKARNASDSLIFGVTPSGSGSLGDAHFVGDVRLFHSTAAYDAADPEIRLTSAGAIDNPGMWTAANFMGSDAGAQTKLEGALLVRKPSTMEGGLLVKANSLNTFEVADGGSITLHRAARLDRGLTFTSGGLTLVGGGSDLVYPGTPQFNTLTAAAATSVSSSLTATHGTFSGDLTTPGTIRAAGGITAGSTTADLPAAFIGELNGSGSGASKSNGIAIQVNHSGSAPDENNVYVNFQNKGGSSIGQIRGENDSNWDDDAFKALERGEFVTQTTIESTEVAWAGKELASAYSDLAAHLGIALSELIPDSWCCSMLIPIGCIIIPFPGFPLPDFAEIPAGHYVHAMKANVAHQAQLDFLLTVAELAEVSAYLGVWDSANSGDWSGGGVSYASGNGDYAEWLPRRHTRQAMHPRQIVGVVGGEVTLRTDHADHLMVISSSPIVAGAEPAENPEAYEAVAFMGQVPVDVIGPVAAGDFIVPSGDHDGFGVAVSPEDFNVSHLDQILGIAWQSGSDKHFNTVNVAIGLSNAASDLVFDAFDSELDEMVSEIASLKRYLLHGAAAPALAPAEIVDVVELSTAAAPVTGRSDEVAGQTLAAVSVGESAPVQVDAKPVARPTPLGLSESEAAEAARDQFYAGYSDYLGGLLGPIADLDDLKAIAAGYANTPGSPAPMLQRANDEFVTKMMLNTFTGDALKSMVRQQVLGNPQFALFENIKPGTQAEQELLNKFEGIIRSAMREQ